MFSIAFIAQGLVCLLTIWYATGLRISEATISQRINKPTFMPRTLD